MVISWSFVKCVTFHGSLIAGFFHGFSMGTFHGIDHEKTLNFNHENPVGNLVKCGEFP